MKRIAFGTGVLFALIISLVGAGCTAAPTPTPTPTAAPIPPTPTPKPATLKVASDSTLGQFLVDEQGRTLYLFLKDAQKESTCYEACAQNWPPLLTAGKPVAGEGVDAALIGTTTRKDGTIQATYNGWPLYYFAQDQKPGDTKGQGVKDVWYIVSPNGEPIK